MIYYKSKRIMCDVCSRAEQLCQVAQSTVESINEVITSLCSDNRKDRIELELELEIEIEKQIKYGIQH